MSTIVFNDTQIEQLPVTEPPVNFVCIDAVADMYEATAFFATGDAGGLQSVTVRAPLYDLHATLCAVLARRFGVNRE